ncbi:hypothetical protein ABMA28_014891 [Loxostege sticticalis]|uniref:Uncharacterized protein n=1 Tax=Loxostege sticticalis TaxID=481309 RepID=A0ABD0TCM4_LOXSC
MDCRLVFVLLFSPHIFCHSGDPVMYFPPFEVRTVRDQTPPFMNEQFQTRSPGVSQMQPKQILHTTAPPPKVVPPPNRVEKEKIEAKNFTFSELLEAVNNLEENKEHHEVSRSAGYDYPPYGYRPQSYGYQQPSYGYQPQPQPPSYGPYGYNDAAYIPPKAVHHTSSKISLLKPDLGDLVKPVATKVAGKVSGVIGLVLALLTGSAPNDIELKGFKDIVINGIVKPLLLAKGGLKSLISKLTIPVIALLLINLEVLITVWWLWEDCPEPVSPPPPYPYPKPTYPNGYNSYR